MIPGEDERKRFSEQFKISPKTSSEQLVIWSKQRWPSDSRIIVAGDIIKNGQELLMESGNIWESVLDSMRIQRFSNVYAREAVIAANDAIIVGALGAVANWPMHHPAMVYQSGICIAYNVQVKSKELEGFESQMRQAAVSYGNKTLPHAVLCMEILDFLLGIANRANHRTIIEKVQILLGREDVKEAYSLIKSRGALVRLRGPNFSRTSTSSILTPPNPGI